MTQNLRLAGGDLTIDNSNIDSSIYNTDTNSDGINDVLRIPSSTSTNFSVYDEFRLMSASNNSYGYWYNWYTATATSGTRAMVEGNAPYSICPKGWELPVGGGNGDFYILYTNYNSYTLMTNGFGPAFVLAGYRTSSTDRQGIIGLYWSKTTYGNDRIENAYYMLLGNDSNRVLPTNDDKKERGYSIRCMAL